MAQSSPQSRELGFPGAVSAGHRGDTDCMNEPSDRRSTGGCLCGAVRYEVTGPLRDVENCHCSRRRRTHGHLGAYTAAPSSALTLTEERGLRWHVADGRERGFCAECGASLFWRRTRSDQTSITAGTLDPPTVCVPPAYLHRQPRGLLRDRRRPAAVPRHRRRVPASVIAAHHIWPARQDPRSPHTMPAARDNLGQRARPRRADPVVAGSATRRAPR